MDFYSYISISFEERGYDKQGCNCWGLVKLWLLEQRGYELPSYEEFYSDTADIKAARKILEEKESKSWLTIKPGEEEPGDVILLRIKDMPWHVGIVAPKQKMLHVERGADSVIEPYNGMKWKNRVLGFYRYQPNPQ